MGEATVRQSVSTGQFASLYEPLEHRVFQLCRHLLGSSEAARDAANEVFLRARHACDSYDPARPFANWLLSIASHYCLDQLRRQKLERRLFVVPQAPAAEPEAREPSPLSELLAKEQKEALQAAMRELPEASRAPLVMRYEGELTYDQIGAVLGVARNEVGVLIFRAKKQLRRTLETTHTEAVR